MILCTTELPNEIRAVELGLQRLSAMPWHNCQSLRVLQFRFTDLQIPIAIPKSVAETRQATFAETRV